MAGYQRQSAADIVPTAVVRAAPINNELNALRDAFLLAGGHRHDGSATEGNYVTLIADSDALNKVVVDTANNRVGVFVEVAAAAVEQVRVQDGAIVPVTDNDVDLGTTVLEFKDLFIDGTANIDSLVADTADINAGTIDNTVIGATTPVAATVTNLTVNTAATIASADINAGTIDGAVIGGSSAQAITGTTITASTGFVGGLTGAVTGNTAGTHTGAVVGNVTGNITGNVTASTGTSTFNDVTINGGLNMDASSAATITNLTSPTNSGDAATKGYVDTSISNLVASAPGVLDTLDELAAALGDDANFATTVTNSIATKLALAGGTMSGAIAMGTSKITGLGNPTANQDAATKTYVDTADALKLSLTGGTMSGAIAMGTSKITGLGTPTADADATTKLYVDGILGSATAAATSAAAAATSASNAATSASNASTSASAASTSASNASSSATAAAASYDSFDDRYLGPKASAPSVDNDGNALLTGALYWNSTSSNLFAWTGSTWTAAAFTASGFATLTGTETLTNKTLTAPAINLINDTSGNEVLNFSPTASAVDYVTVKNGTGVATPLHIYADGPSANIGLHLQPKGTGLITISDGTDFNKGIRFRSSSSAASAVTLLDAVSTAGRVITLPDATTTLVGRDTTDTLTNKTIAFGSNTFSGANSPVNGGTGVANNAAMTVTGSGNFAYTRTLTGATNVTFPTTGTLATLAGTETLTNKTIAFGSNTLSDVASLSTAQTVTGTKTFSGTSSTKAIVLNDAAEVTTVSATAATGTINYDITTQSVLYYTSSASANWTVNFRGSSGTSLNTLMATGESMTVAFLVTQGATAYYNSAVQVDGTTSGVTTRWFGGAPTAGNASGIDSYRYLIIKTGSATFTVLASNTQFKA